MDNVSIKLIMQDIQEWLQGYGQYYTIEELENLQFWNLYKKISELPESIGNLKNLQALNLSDNQLQSLPDSIGNLKNLKKIYFRDNNLRMLPWSIKKCGIIRHGWINATKINVIDNKNVISWVLQPIRELI